MIQSSETGTASGLSLAQVDSIGSNWFVLERRLEDGGIGCVDLNSWLESHSVPSGRQRKDKG